MNITTVIVTLGKGSHLTECKKSLKQSKLNGIHHEILIVDNARENLGFTGGNNKGIQQALQGNANAILILNDDTKVDPHAIQRLYDMLQSDKNIGIVVPKIYFYPGYEFHKNRYEKREYGKVIWYAGGTIDWNNVIGTHIGVDDVDNGKYDHVKEIDFATGCCALIRREVFERIGLFDDRYFLYLEDLDFSVRAKMAGYKIVFEPKAMIWHKNAQSSGSGSSLHDYFFTRNRLLFGMTYANSRTRFALLREAMKILISGSMWKRKAVIDFLRRNYGKGSWSPLAKAAEG